MLMRGSWYSRFDMSFSPLISHFRIYFVPPAAAKEKKELVGTPHTPAKDCVLCTPVSYVACGGEMGKRICGDTPHPGKGLCPLHSCFIRCLRWRMEKAFSRGSAFASSRCAAPHPGK